MSGGERLTLAAVIAAVVTGLVMAFDKPVTGDNVFWGMAVLIGIVVALVLVYGAVLVIWWSEQ